MSRPTILTVDDDPQVSAAIARDLRNKYSRDYRIVRTSSGEEGLEVARGARAARPAGGADRGRPADAADDRHRDAGPRPGARARPGCQAAAAHGVRRHRRGDPRHQRHRPRPLPPQAVGPAGGAPLPGPRRPARRLAAREPRPHLRGAGGRPPVVRAQPRGQDVPGPQPQALPLVRRGARRGGPTTGRPGRCRTRRPAARAAARRRPAAVPDQPRGRRRPGSEHACQTAALRRVHRRRRTGRAGRRRLRGVRGPEHDRRRATGPRWAGRPERRHRELPRLPARPERLRPDPARDGPGETLRRRDGAGPRRGRAGDPGAGPRGAARG